MPKLNTIKYTFVFIFVIVIALFVRGQENVVLVYGGLKIEDGSKKGSHVIVYKDGAKVQTIDASRKFEFELKLDHKYTIEFVKEGYITKKISLDTNAPEDRKEFRFEPLAFNVQLFPQFDDINTVIFNQPVGKYAYDPEMEDFYYDTDYTKSIQSALAEVERKIIEKQKEKKKAEEEEVAKKASEEAAAKKAAEEAERKKADEEAAAKKAAEAEEKRLEKEAQEEEARKAAAAEEERKAAEKAAAAEEKRLAKEAQEEETRKAAEAAAAEEERKAAEKAAAAEEKRLAKEAQEEEARNKAAAAAAAEEEARNKAATAAEEEARNKAAATAAEEEARNKAAAAAAEEEEARNKAAKAAEEEARNKAKARAVAEEKAINKIDAQAVKLPPKHLDHTNIHERYPAGKTIEDYEEFNQQITKTVVNVDGHIIVFKHVTNHWGGNFYFKGSKTVSKMIYDQELGQY